MISEHMTLKILDGISGKAFDYKHAVRAFAHLGPLKCGAKAFASISIPLHNSELQLMVNLLSLGVPPSLRAVVF
jgi:hypothetical protein